MAGALGVILGGPSSYRGIVVNNPYIGMKKKVRSLKSIVRNMG